MSASIQGGKRDLEIRGATGRDGRGQLADDRERTESSSTNAHAWATGPLPTPESTTSRTGVVAGDREHRFEASAGARAEAADGSRAFGRAQPVAGLVPVRAGAAAREELADLEGRGAVAAQLRPGDAERAAARALQLDESLDGAADDRVPERE